jgi:Tripartite tricarboxylate transporter TctB family
LLGILLALLGVAIIVNALRKGGPDGDKIGKWAWKPLFFVIAANLVFGLLLGGLPRVGLPAMGMIAGIFGLTFLASMAGEEFKLKEVLILSIILSIGSYLAFVVLLKLQFPVWPTFITG